MNTPSRWFRLGRRAPGAEAPPLRSDVLNSGTWATAEDLIDLQRHAGKIGLMHAGPARARLAGDHLSRFRGRGMDYQESRGYQPGDDIRSMDWRVTARTGNPHVKVYQEERERPVVVFVDLNPGMFFGTQGMLKSVLAARAAALIAWAALAHGDRVGAMLFNGEHGDLQPRGGKHGVLRLIRQLVAHTDPRTGIEAPDHEGGLNAALSRLRRVARPGGLIVLISDFYGIDEDSARHLAWLRRHNDIVALQIVDAIEEAPPPSGRYGVATAGRRAILDTGSSAARRAYSDYFGRHHEQVQAAMRRHAIPLLRLSTGGDLVAALRWHFAAGESPRAGRTARPGPVIDDRLAA
jgi:uncharacterized protein (DUF58 family)